MLGVLGASLTLNPALATPPENDNFAEAQEISVPFSSSIDVTDASAEFSERNCWGYQTSSRTVWYRLIGSDASRTVVTGFSEEIRTIVGVYKGGPTLKELTRVNCQTASAGGKARVAWQPVVGETYFIQVGGYDGDRGVVDFDLLIPPPPPNDERANAEIIGYSEPLDFEGISEENAGAGAIGEPSPTCVSVFDNTPTVWYKLTTPSEVAADFVFHAIGNWFTRVALYRENPDLSLQELGCTYIQYPKRISPQPDTTYYFQLVEPWYGGAPMGLHIHPTLVNDNFSEALEIGEIPFSYPDDLWNATFESGEPRPSCKGWGVSTSTWFRYTADSNRLLDVSALTQDSYYAGWVGVYSGSSLADLVELACKDTYGRAVQVEIKTGETIYLQMGPYSYARTNVDLRVTDADPVHNDHPSGAYDLSRRTLLPGTYSQSTNLARLSDDEPAPSCGEDPGSTVWYSLSSPVSQGVSLQTHTYDSILAAYDSDLNELVCNDDISATDSRSKVTLQMEAGRTYLFSVSGTGRVRGSLTVQVGPAPPLNDNFSEAAVIEGPPYADAQTTLSATLETGEPQPSADCIGPNLNPDSISFTVWYRYTPVEDMTLTASVFGNNLQTLVAVYTGDGLTSLSQVACSGPAGGDLVPGWSGARLQAASFSAQAGVTYYFQVGHRSKVGQRAVPFELNRTGP